MLIRENDPRVFSDVLRQLTRLQQQKSREEAMNEPPESRKRPRPSRADDDEKNAREEKNRRAVASGCAASASGHGLSRQEAEYQRGEMRKETSIDEDEDHAKRIKASEKINEVLRSSSKT